PQHLVVMPQSLQFCFQLDHTAAAAGLRLTTIQLTPPIQVVVIDPQVTGKLCYRFAAAFHEPDCFAFEFFGVAFALGRHCLSLLNSVYLSLSFSSTESGQVQIISRTSSKVMHIPLL